MGSAASINSAAAVTSSATEGAAGAGRRVRIAADSQDLPTPSASASGASTAAGMTGFSSGDGDRSNWESTRRSPSPLDSELNADELDHEVANLPPEVAALLIEKGLVQQLSSKQKKWQEIKVTCAGGGARGRGRWAPGLFTASWGTATASYTVQGSYFQLLDSTSYFGTVDANCVGASPSPVTRPQAGRAITCNGTLL